MVDLKGPLIRTLAFKNNYSIKVKTGQEIRISSNQEILGDEGMFVIDYPMLDEKLKINDKIIIDYGAIVMTVIGFENEDKYLR
jgi:pyruvate kinase